MKKIIIITVVSLIVALIFVFLVRTFLLRSNEKGAMQVTASPESEVFLNGKSIGKTPLCKCSSDSMIKTGEYTLRIVPQGGLPEFQEKISINASVLTVVDRKFGAGAKSEGSIITLTKLKRGEKNQLLITSTPTRSEVLLDNSSSGFTPLLLSGITDSDHELTVRKSGYLDKKVRIRTPAGYKLSANVYLSVDEGSGLVVPTTTPIASPSAIITPVVSQITILQTPTGFLRVRASSEVSSAEIGRVTPGQTYPLASEIEGWYEITLQDGQNGWISSDYASKVTTE